MHLAHIADPSSSTTAPAADVAAITGGVNLLLTGTDTRTGQGGAYSTSAELAASAGAGNNDVTMLLHIAQDHHSVSVISFPRDLMVAVPTCPQTDGSTASASSRVMLNTTLARGGLSCVVVTIEKLTGLQIPFAAQISFDGVTAMSNAVGGVTVCIASPINDLYTNPPLHLAAGQQTIVGDEALSFLRSRHGVGDGSDLGRISNQQVFMAALARKVESGGVLGNPVTLYALAKAATGNMLLSDTLTNPTTLVQIALALKDTGLANMVFLQYPTVADPQDVNRVIPQSTGATIVNAALVADQPIVLSGLPGRAAVIDKSAATATATAIPTPTPTPSPSASARTPGVATPTTTTPTPTGAVLPSTVTGQTAAEQTCSKGN
ncbi:MULTISPECIES: LCP family protein [unclassified Cryobacterium]|uniref:LCP family protein n=1 Tax=unclassified Cryobacterium TaxID=2649013 RepID=UPI002AB56608|nr:MULTISPECIES: LCP family protein [unclassified Cryobacterium]MDY7541755.1 LCP family protein [Cryobacterium sp. 5B3]MEB0000187.1 LCP family protein [Cryobacterium sp. RTS3]MEB0266659.1 LCP family protein [Cryobacterium sp. 10I5]MEB0275866.1 LCP family protein [Cryobacterium sp. 5B3]